MSLESLLLNALKCHLVFAGSLQRTEKWGQIRWEAGGYADREGWGECIRMGCWPLLCLIYLWEDIVDLKILFTEKWEQEIKRNLSTQEFWLHLTLSQWHPAGAREWLLLFWDFYLSVKGFDFKKLFSPLKWFQKSLNCESSCCTVGLGGFCLCAVIEWEGQSRWWWDVNIQ